MENREKTSGIRINKYLASCGICSRREADALVDKGKVMIDGRVAVSGDRVFDNSTVICNGKNVSGPDEKVVLAYYKPVGVICSSKDKHAEKLVTDELSYKTRVTYAGRLDKDSEGLLLMTNDGDLIDKLMRSKNAHEKEYKVKIKEEVTDELLEALRNGVYLKDLDKTTRKCEVRYEGSHTFTIVLTQGLNRQIRRMCETLGVNVVRLKRVRVANIELGDLKSGKYRVLSGEEKDKLYALCGLS